MRAAYSGLGGSWFGVGIRGFCTVPIGLTGTRPPNRSRAGAAEHGVAPSDRRRGQRQTQVRRTPLVAPGGPSAFGARRTAGHGSDVARPVQLTRVHPGTGIETGVGRELGRPHPATVAAIIYYMATPRREFPTPKHSAHPPTGSSRRLPDRS